MSIFEVLMLLCFGAAWPLSIWRSCRSKSTNGKSVLFLLVIIMGYLCGIAHKLLYAPDFVALLYVLNISMVMVDTGLWFRNKRLETANAKEEVKKKVARTTKQIFAGFFLLLLCYAGLVMFQMGQA